MVRSLFFKWLLLAGCFRANAQGPPNRYVVVTFEERYKVSQHGTQTYYWIQPLDSVASHPLQLAALLLANYSKDNLDDICQGRPADPFVVTTRTTYAFSAEHLAARAALQAIIHRHRKRIQTIRKQWRNGQSSVTRVYATLLAGQFCVAHLRRQSADGEQYHGSVFLPFADFQPLPGPPGKRVLKQFRADYSQVNYAIVPQ